MELGNQRGGYNIFKIKTLWRTRQPRAGEGAPQIVLDSDFHIPLFHGDTRPFGRHNKTDYNKRNRLKESLSCHT
jgi:hypothetical protein